jgi:hypothetical protein
LGPECSDCLRIAQRLDEAAEAGQRIEGGELSVVGELGTSLSGDSAELSFVARVEAVAMYEASGTLVPETQYAAEERLPSGLGLAWSEQKRSWLVSGLTIG